jgi:SagB-type dehydrogenase family enzyme
VVCYWREDRLVLHDVASGERLHGSALAVEILQFFRDGGTLDGLRARLPHVPARQIEGTVEVFLRHSFLRPDAGGAPAVEKALSGWNGWNPAAAFFHFATKDPPWATGRKLDLLEARLARKGETAPPTAAVKRHAGAPVVRLPSVRPEGELCDVLLERRTWRGFGRGPMALEDLALILDLTWGVQSWAQAGVNDSVALKTSPSGGARHSIEAYVMALRVRGLARGLYHYVSDRKHLERLSGRAGPGLLETYLAGQWWFRSAAAVVFMTAVLPRVRWRYPFARGYRAVLIEAGHLCQTFCLLATWRKLAPFCTAALADSRIEKDLGVDGFDEVVLYAAGVGTRPAGMKGKAWVQWPEHRPGHPYLPPARRSRTRA